MGIAVKTMKGSRSPKRRRRVERLRERLAAEHDPRRRDVIECQIVAFTRGRS